MESRHVIIEGIVQRVCFRDYTRRQGLKHNLTGWVRNLPNGSVECSFTGESEDVALMLDWFWQGSPMSEVTNIIVREISADLGLTSFEIRR